MSFRERHHSKLIQKTILSPYFADQAFNQDANSNEIPIVLIPRSPYLASIILSVPNDHFFLWQQWHRDMGPLSPGLIWFWPAWNRISHIVRRANITYTAPAKYCLTADNVMVDADISLTFRIGPDAEAARTFIYRIGAHRFDELISAATEEVTRNLIHSVNHDRVNDVREELARSMLFTLNSKCNTYGVQILTVAITNIILPEDLQRCLESISALKTKMEEQKKTHENRIRVLEDEAAKELETVRRSYARMLQEAVAERKRYEIEKREMEERAHGEARVQEVQAMTSADVALKKAQGDEVVEKVKARQNAEAMLKKAQMQCQTMKLEAEKKANVLIKESEAGLKIAESKAAAMVTEAEAEGEGAEALSEKRRYELEWARLAVLEKIAGKGRRFITGDKGEAILNDLLPQSSKAGGGARGMMGF